MLYPVAMPAKLVLVDGSSYLHRAYNALPELTGPAGQPTGAVYGVINMLRSLLRQEKPDRFAVIFDARGKTFRHEMFPDYKAHRPPTPPDMRAQVEALFRVIRASGYPLLQVGGVEADDVIGTLAHRGAQHGFAVVISTCDKDMTQLLAERITMTDTMKGEKVDAAAVMKKFGVAPGQVADFLALTGDTSDNIPGVRGVGPKTAAKWLAEYGTLGGVMENAGKVKGKAGETLRATAPVLPLYLELTTIRRDVELDIEPDALMMGDPDTGALRELYQEYGFTSWLRGLGRPAAAGGDGDSADAGARADSADAGADSAAETAITETIAANPGYRLILTRETLQQWLDKLQDAGHFAFDAETTGPDYMHAEIVGLSFAVEEGEAAYLPLAHDYEGAPAQLPRDETLEQLRQILESAKHGKIGHNLKYDREVLVNHGIRLDGIRHDSMLQSYVYNSVASRHDLAGLAAKYLGVRAARYEDIAGKGVKQKPFNRIALRTACDYAAAAADLSLRLHRFLHPRLERESGPALVYRDIEMPLLPVLADIERKGVLIAPEPLKRQSRELSEGMEEISRQAFQLAGREFNMDSPKQIQEILFEEAGLPVIRKTPKGQPSTAEDVLQELAVDYELPRAILEFRSLSKLKSTYTDKLPAMMDAASGRVHTCYHQAVTATGRLSSSDPNLQNIPVRTAQGRRIRRAFIAPDGCQLIAADYSQIEMRIMAHLSRDKNLMKVFERGGDIHAATAAEVFSVKPDKVAPDQRRIAKAINFGLIYGMSAFGLAKQLGLARGAAQEYVNAYFARYPGVESYMERTRKEARERGYVETIFGRRLYLPEINAKNVHRRRYAERTAINAPMQGSAADIIKRAMTDLHAWLKSKGKGAAIIMQVHDELVLEAAQDRAEEVITQCRKRMSAAADLAVPLIVDAAAAGNWDEAH